MLRAVIVKLGLVAESVGEEEGCLDSQFLLKPPLCGDAIGFSAAWMTTAGIGPEVRPEGLFLTPLLEQHFAA